MKELSILFYLDGSQKKYLDTVKHTFTETHSLIELRSKKTTFESLENPKNGEYFSEFPFLFNKTFEEVTYSIGIKYFAISNIKSEEKYTKFDLSLLKHSRKQIKRKISERFAKENSLLSRLKTETNSFGSKENSKVSEMYKVVENSVTKYQENETIDLIEKTPMAKTLKTRKVGGNLSAADIQNEIKYKCSHLTREKSNSKEKTPMGKTLKTRKVAGNLSAVDLHNETIHKCPHLATEKSDSKEKTPKAKTLKTRKVAGNLSTADLQNETTHKCPRLVIEKSDSNEKAPKAKILKTRKVVGNLSVADLQNETKYKCPHLVTEKSDSKEKTPKTKTLKTRKVAGNLSPLTYKMKLNTNVHI